MAAGAPIMVRSLNHYFGKGALRKQMAGWLDSPGTDVRAALTAAAERQGIDLG